MKVEFELLKHIILNTTGCDVHKDLRLRNLVDARKIFSLIAYEEINRTTFSTIGIYLNKDHSSIVHNKKMALEHIKYDAEFKALYEEIKKRFIHEQTITIEDKLIIEIKQTKEYLKILESKLEEMENTKLQIV